MKALMILVSITFLILTIISFKGFTLNMIRVFLLLNIKEATEFGEQYDIAAMGKYACKMIFLPFTILSTLFTIALFIDFPSWFSIFQVVAVSVMVGMCAYVTPRTYKKHKRRNL